MTAFVRFHDSNFGIDYAMDDVLQIELTPEERNVLLRGLRYVRRATMLETREPSVEDERRRAGILDEIQMLSQRLETTDPLATAAT